jgi:hypothetical protein
VADIQVLVVTSGNAPSSAIVPVLAAIEAAGMRVRAIDVGGDGGVTDRIKRTLLGDRRLKRELDVNPPDAAVVFDPNAALALSVARDEVQNPAPVIAVVGDLEPAAAWGQTDADRFLAVDEVAAVALADSGVEGERILVVGAIGERAFAEAGQTDRQSLRTRFKLSGKVALVEVAGFGAEGASQLAMQLGLLDGGDAITFLFDAAGDIEAAATLRRSVPSLGLRAKLFGATADAALLWRAADIIVARPRPEVISRVLLVGGKLVALIDDQVPNGAKLAAALESRKRAIAVKGLLLLATAIDSAFGGQLSSPSEDGGDNVADIVAVVANDKRAVIDERRAAAQAATRDRVRAASAAASAAAAATAMPGELEDLGGEPAESPPVPDAGEIDRLRNEVSQRVAEMTKSMNAARDAATDLADKAKGAAARGAADESAQLERKADAERAKMHSMLAELAQLESELRDLERVRKTIHDIPKTSSSAPPPRAEPDEPRASRAPPRSIDDELASLKKNAGSPRPASGGAKPSGQGQATSSSKSKDSKSVNVEDELAALKKKMQNAPPKKKP